MTRHYTYAVIAFFVIAAGFGVVGPMLVSADSDVALALGVGVIVLLPLALYALARRWAKHENAKRIINKVREAVR